MPGQDFFRDFPFSFCQAGLILLGGLTILGAPVNAPASAPGASSTVPIPPRRLAIDLTAQGVALEAEGKNAEAEKMFRASLGHAPSPAAYYHLGRVLAAQGKRDEAVTAFDQALAMNPGYESARVARERARRGNLGSLDLVALDNEAMTAESLRETAQTNSLTLAQASSPSTEGRRRPTTVAQTGVEIPAPPATAKAPQAQQTPSSPRGLRRFLPAARNRDDLARTAIIENESRPKIISPQRATDPSEPSSSTSTAPAGGRRGVPVERIPSSVAPSEESGGSARNENPAGGNRPSPLARVVNPNNWTRRPPPSALPESTTPGGQNRDQINEAAFGPAASKRRSSIAFGQPTGTTALGSFAFHRDRGDQYRFAERWADARVEYDFALRQAPGDAETRALLGEMYARQGDRRRALRNLDQAAKDAPTMAAVPYRRGNAFRALNQKELAVGAYLDALRLDPNHKDTLNNLGVTYMETGRADRAATTFERLLAIDSSNANAILNLGILYEEQLNQPAKAEEFYNRYLALGDVPRKTEVRRWLTLLRRSSSNP